MYQLVDQLEAEVGIPPYGIINPYKDILGHYGHFCHYKDTWKLIIVPYLWYLVIFSGNLLNCCF